MNKIIPINKDLEFKTSIGDITSIALDKDINTNEDSITGNLIVSGTYKMLKTSTTEEDFSYTIPIDITIGDNFDLENSIVDIDDFHYDLKNDNTLDVKIDLLISNIIERVTPDKEEQEKIENVQSLEKLELRDIYKEGNVENPEKVDEQLDNKSESLFTKFLDSDDTYVTYKVYFVRENDTIESILEKYNITKDELANYNNLEEIKINDKIVIPYRNEKA